MDNRKKHTKLSRARNPKSKKLLWNKYEKTVVHYVFSIKELFVSIVCYLFSPAILTDYTPRIMYNWTCLYNLRSVCATWNRHACAMQAFLSDVLIFFNEVSLTTLSYLTVKNLYISKEIFDSVFHFAKSLQRCHFNFYRLSVDILLNLTSDVLEEIAGVFVDHQNVIDTLRVNVPNLKRGSFEIAIKLTESAFINFKVIEEITIEGAFDISNVRFESNAKLKKIILCSIKKLTLQNNTNLKKLHCCRVCRISFDVGSVQNLKNLNIWYFPCLAQFMPACKNLSDMSITFDLIDKWMTQLTSLQSLTIHEIKKQYFKKNGKSAAFAMIPAVKKLRLKSSEFEFFDEFLMLFDGHNLETLELDCQNNFYNAVYSKQKNQKAVCEKFPNLKFIVFYNLHTKIKKSTVFHNANIDVSLHFDT